MSDYPKIQIGETEYFEVGCKVCGCGGEFSIYFNGTGNFAMRCNKCGRGFKVEPGIVQTEKDKTQVVDMRLFT